MLKRLSVLLVGAALAGCSWLPDPQPPEPPDPCGGTCPAYHECNEATDQCEPIDNCPLDDWPWCGEVDQQCSSEESPCKTNPSDDPFYCEEAIPCNQPPPWPEPQCQTFTDRGGTLQPLGDACDCYFGNDWIPCDQPPPTGDCTLGTPTATELFADGRKVEIAPRIEGRWNVSATPLGAFGREYYCTPEMNWPEACAAGRNYGPVAPDGHPQREACERVFLGQNCPTFVMAECTGHGNECPITFDPFFVINGVNQNHPRNAEAGCHGTDWIKDAEGHVLQGQFWLASAHGKGYIKACNKGKVVCTRSSFEVNH